MTLPSSSSSEVSISTGMRTPGRDRGQADKLPRLAKYGDFVALRIDDEDKKRYVAVCYRSWRPWRGAIWKRLDMRVGSFIITEYGDEIEWDGV